MTMLELKCLLFFSMSKMENYKKVKTKSRNTWTEEMLQEALHERGSKARIRGVNNKILNEKKKS